MREFWKSNTEILLEIASDIGKRLPTTIRPIFSFRDMWIGAYYDNCRRELYVHPVPWLGFVLRFGTTEVNPYDVSDERIIRTVQYLDTWGESEKADTVIKLACERDKLRDQLAVQKTPIA